MLTELPPSDGGVNVELDRRIVFNGRQIGRISEWQVIFVRTVVLCVVGVASLRFAAVAGRRRCLYFHVINQIVHWNAIANLLFVDIVNPTT